MAQAFLYDHVRTPRGEGRPEGKLYEVTPVELATQTLASLRERSELDTRLIDDVILGTAMPWGEQGGSLARVAVVLADYAQTAPGLQLNRFCASGLDAVNLAASQVAGGFVDAVIAGGVESMSRVSMTMEGPWPSDPQVSWKTHFIPQGLAADLIASIDGLSRIDVDKIGVLSQQRAARAWQNGWFQKSVAPVKDILGCVLLERDEHPRNDSNLDTLGQLKPAFALIGEQGGFDAVALQRYPQLESIKHVHTAGNSSGIVDGAAAVLVGSAEFGERAGLRPRARVRAFASIGSDPTIMLTGVSAACRKALDRARMSKHDIDLWEVNEAFAAVVLRLMRDLDLSMDVINVNGGSIAMGHPLGATGAMLVGTALDELERRNRATAMIVLCAAIGMATATIIERI